MAEDFDPEIYARGIRELNRREAERFAERLERARGEAARLGRAILDADAGVRRVFLFGSVAGGEPRSEHFDIDLALDGGDVYAAMDVGESSEFEVDLVELTLLPEDFRASVLAQGIVVAER